MNTKTVQTYLPNQPGQYDNKWRRKFEWEFHSSVSVPVAMRFKSRTF